MNSFFGFYPAKSLQRALQQVLGKRAVINLIRTVPDARELGRQAAKQFCLSEESLMQKVADSLTLPYVSKLTPMDPKRLPSRQSIARFRQAGASLILRDGVAVGLACVNPTHLYRVIPEASDWEVCISTWTEIENALEKATESNAHLNEITESDIDELLEELVSLSSTHKVDHVLIQFIANQVHYFLSLPDGSEAKGEIDSRVAKYLRSRLDFARVGASLFLTRQQELDCGVECVNRDPLTYAIRLHKESSSRLSNQKIVELPKQLDEPSDVQQKNLPKKLSLKSDNVVLLIDDDPTFAGVLIRHLERQGIETVHYGEADKALQDLRSGELNPYAIVCDCHMPVMNGDQFVRRLKGEQDLQGIPIFMLTSDDDVETHLGAIGNGVDAFLNKTENPRILSAHLNRVKEVQSLTEAA